MVIRCCVVADVVFIDGGIISSIIRSGGGPPNTDGADVVDDVIEFSSIAVVDTDELFAGWLLNS